MMASERFVLVRGAQDASPSELDALAGYVAFFFSSRRRHTRCSRDWSSDVCSSDLAGALGDLDAGQDAWINTCVNGIGERAGNADLLSTLLALRHGFGLAGRAEIGDPVDE